MTTPSILGRRRSAFSVAVSAALCLAAVAWADPPKEPAPQSQPESLPSALKTAPTTDRFTIVLAPDLVKQLAPPAESAASSTPGAPPTEGAAPPAKVDAGPGRLILFFIRDDLLSTRRLRGAAPADAPFYTSPQPIASVDLDGFAEGRAVVIDGRSLAWPGSIDDLEGEFRVQAVYRRNQFDRGHQAPGNLFSAISTVSLAKETHEETRIELSAIIEAKPLPTAPSLKFVEIKSDLLSKHYGRDVSMRAGVVFPKDYENLTAKRRFWPTIYVIPGFGGDHTDAENYASMVMTPGTELLAPQAVWVILDPNDRLGHHGFADTEAFGPRATALVTEFIPALEERFRLVREPSARIVTGHSSGGWASLWLGLMHPETFGACFSSAPDPVDFSAFQRTNIYSDTSAFTTPEGTEQASFRLALGPTEDRVMMTVREEVGVEHVLGPRGDSGEQWGTWGAMFGRLDPTTQLPIPLFDPVEGTIDRTVAERDWARYDIARLVQADWPRFRPVLAKNVRLLCGDRDSYYLNLAVAKLKEKVDALRKADVDAGRSPIEGPGYIELVPRATHETIVPLTTMRWNTEMIEHLRRGGHHD